MGTVHELPITESILQAALSSARAYGAVKVSRINLVIGELSDFRQEWIQRYFDYLSAGTPAQGAVIAVERVPAAFRCGTCNVEFEAALGGVDRFRCPGCAGADLALVRGREFLIKDMEAE